MDIYEKLARCSSVGEVKRMLRGNGASITFDRLMPPTYPEPSLGEQARSYDETYSIWDAVKKHFGLSQ